MVFFKTALILQTNSKKEFSLPETCKITCFSFNFAVTPNKRYLVAGEDGISLYTTNPLNRLKKIDYKKEIKNICASDNTVFLLNNDSLVFYSQSKFNVISSDFSNSKLVLISNCSSVAVQKRSELIIYDSFGQRHGVYKGQVAFSDNNLLLLADLANLNIYIKDNLAFKVAFPAFITAVIADPLFTKIYCATEDNNIYVFDLNGKPMKALEYHTSPVNCLKLSFCGKYLYSCDGVRLCIWGTQFNTLMGYIDVEEGIEKFETILVDDYEYKIEEYLI